VHPACGRVPGCRKLASLLLRRDCVEISLLAAAAVTAGEGSPGDAEPPNRFCDQGISGILDGVAARRKEAGHPHNVGHPHNIVLHDLAEKHAVDVRVIDASSFEIWRKVVSPDAGCAARPSRSAEARSMSYGAFQLDCKVTGQESLRKGWLFGRPAPIFMSPRDSSSPHRP
jgi:hypothetical protein